jgi:hypothetical protein
MRRLTIISIATLLLVLGAGNAHAVKSVQQSCGVAACPQGFHHPLVDHTDRVQECARSQDQTWTCYWDGKSVTLAISLVLMSDASAAAWQPEPMSSDAGLVVLSGYAFRPTHGPRADCFAKCGRALNNCLAYLKRSYQCCGEQYNAYFAFCHSEDRTCRAPCEVLEDNQPACQPGWNSWTYKGLSGCCPPGQKYFAWGSSQGCVKATE